LAVYITHSVSPNLLSASATVSFDDFGPERGRQPPSLSRASGFVCSFEHLAARF
jgi:hypothetical protein